jgi:hypothetical protein
MDDFLNQQYPAGLLSTLGINPEDLRRQQQQAGLLSAGLQLLAGSGYSPVRRTTGELVGQAGMAGVQGMQQAGETAIDRALKGMQVQEFARRQQDAERLRQARQTFEDRITAATQTVPTAQSMAAQQSNISPEQLEGMSAQQVAQQALQAGLPTRQVTDQGAADQAVMNYLRTAAPAEYAKLLVKEPRQLPTSIQEYQFAVSQGFKGTYAQFKESMARAGASTVNFPSGEERKAGFLTNRIAFNLGQISDIVKKNPPAASPETLPTIVKYLTGSDFLSTKLTSSDRKRIENAQLDILDAALTMGTGAAYTREQLESYRQSYFPQLGEDAAAVADKQQRLNNLLQSAYITSGRAAPPEVSRPQMAEPPAPTTPAPKITQSDADLLKKYLNRKQ